MRWGLFPSVLQDLFKLCPSSSLRWTLQSVAQTHPSQGVERIGFNLISDSPVEAQSLSSVESEAPVWLQSETLWVPGLQLLFLPLCPLLHNQNEASCACSEEEDLPTGRFVRGVVATSPGPHCPFLCPCLILPAPGRMPLSV